MKKFFFIQMATFQGKKQKIDRENPNACCPLKKVDIKIN